ERDPWIVQSLLDMYTASKARWMKDRYKYAETSPWLLADLAEAAYTLGTGWDSYGLAPNLKMLTDFCLDQYRQKLVPAPVDPKVAFADYIRITGDGA
ncbi:MAG: hypothetical protein AB7K36_26820, partial [Chloroflexota bacterium]